MLELIKRLFEESVFLGQRKSGLKEYQNMDVLLERASEQEREDTYAFLKENIRENSPLEAVYLFILMKAERKENYQSELRVFCSHHESHDRYRNVLHLLGKLVVLDRNINLLKQILSYQMKADVGEEELLETYEAILKIERTNYDLITKVARIKAKQDKMEGLNYYKMALQYAVQTKDTASIQDILAQIIELGERGRHFYFPFLKGIDTFSEKNFVRNVYVKIFLMYFNEKEMLGEALDILEHIMDMNLADESFDVRNYLLSCVQEKYKDHPDLESIMEFSRLKRNWVDPSKHYKMFKELIGYRKGGFVHHKSFGYGVIKELIMPPVKKPEYIDMGKIQIDFQEKKAHQMTLRIARNSLKILYRDHLVALKLFSPDRFQEVLSGDDSHLTYCFFRTMDKPFTVSDIREVFTTALFDEELFQTLWKRVKTEVDRNNNYGYKNKVYSFDVSATDQGDAFLKQYNRQRKLDRRMEMALFILDNYPHLDIQKDIQRDFQEFSRTEDALLLSLYGVLMIRKYGVKLAVDPKTLFKEAFSGVDELFFFKLKKDLQRIYIELILDTVEKSEPFIKTLYFLKRNEHLSFILEQLSKRGHASVVKKLYTQSLEEVERYSIPFLTAAGFVLKEGLKGYDKTALYYKLNLSLSKTHVEMKESGDKGEKRREYNHLKHLLFDYDLFEHIQKHSGDEEVRQLIKKLLQLDFLEDYLKATILETATKFDLK